MTETEKKHTLPEPIPVDAKKLIDGLGTIFGGVTRLLFLRLNKIERNV